SLPAAAQEEKRKQAVRLRKQGYSYQEIADKVGVHNLTVGKWIRAYEAQGVSGIKSKPRGREPGSGQRLTPGQENRIRCLIVDKSPDQLKLEYALWTRKAVQQLIAQETGEHLAIRTVGSYLTAWGFTPQKPVKKAYEQNPSQVEKWLKEEYPVI
ncbi:IS630 family transposase, partial [Hahella sp. CR1]|uniref:IS630 family transposase n=1 Tax=Hahella sp. CR1 TaxID=2992807 RepID=UPI002442CA19